MLFGKPLGCTWHQKNYGREDSLVYVYWGDLLVKEIDCKESEELMQAPIYFTYFDNIVHFIFLLPFL